MKKITLLCFVILFSVSSSPSQIDTAFVRFAGDTVKIWNINFLSNCASAYVSEVTLREDTVFIVERDTSTNRAKCVCKFDHVTSLVGLQPGKHTALLQRIIKVLYPIPGDTVIFSTILTFNVAPNAQIFSVSFTQGSCHGDLTPAWTPVVYPLHPGDLWDYSEDLYWHQRQIVEQDSATLGGHRYAVVNGIFTPMYQRQEGDRVFVCSPFDSTERLLYDFTKLQGDTVATWSGAYDTTDMILTYTGMTQQFGLPLRVWAFLRDTRRSIDDELVVTIVDSIGPIAYFPYMGPRLDFQGARIDGRIYGTIMSVPTATGEPDAWQLGQNYPNPFNPVTQINYTVGQKKEGESGRGGEGGRNVQVQLVVYDILGRQVATLVNEAQRPGRYRVGFDATGLPSGVYFYRLQGNGAMLVRRMIVLK